MRLFCIIPLLFFCHVVQAQQGFAFTRITTADGLGLANNVVRSLYQDDKGFIWVGTDNGLQRFDGSKFIKFNPDYQTGADRLPVTSVAQIIPFEGKLMLSMLSIREFGLFDPSTFAYKKIALQTSGALPPRAEFHLWKDSHGEIYMNVLRYGILRYDKTKNVFADFHLFKFPKDWKPNLSAVYEDVQKQQLWFGTDSGLLIYDRKTKTSWTRYNNPKKLPLLNNTKINERITQVYIDQQRRTWIFSWPTWGKGGQYRFCYDSTGTRFLHADTVGLQEGLSGYAEYNDLYETKDGNLWVYGGGALYSYDKNTKRFYYNKAKEGLYDIGIDYDYVYQVMQDKDGGVWIATDKGLYFTSYGNSNYNLVNLIFKPATSITDILELPNGEIWFSSWGGGIVSIDKNLKRIDNFVYHHKPPANWKPSVGEAEKLTWSLCRQSSTGNILIGCNGGALLIHDPVKKTTQYTIPPECNNSTIRYIADDKKGNIWLGTQGGRLIRWSNDKYTVVHDIGTIIYKIFFDKQGWLWLATHEKGLIAIDPASGKVIQTYTANNKNNALFSNTGGDIEQLNDSIIVYGAGALNFINKKTGKIRILSFEDGLPSNTVERVRMDKTGFLWIITSNGLCRYNPQNDRVTPYSRKDGIVLAEQTKAADFETQDGYIVFGGSNAVLMFHPKVFSNNQPPPDVTITDFKLFNQFIPVDSLIKHPEIRLKHNQNSISLYFASLSFMQRDKLTYYYKMEGIDNDWVKADRFYFVNYSLLTPGHYTFKVYCENIEGMRSRNITEIHIHIKPPFWQTWWFSTSLLFVLALLAYVVHDLRVKRLLAVEKLRNRVARDLHDDMGSTLSTINILSAMAKTKMQSDVVKTTEYLGKISDNSQRMMEAMDDIVWSIKPSNDNMQKVAARMREFATSVLEAKDIELDFSVDEDVYDLKLNMEARRDFFLVFKEAVNNAAKYSRAEKVWIRITVENRKLNMLIKDNGVGFDVANADNGNGLGNMRKRADGLNGTINLRSKQGEGTEVNVNVPIIK